VLMPVATAIILAMLANTIVRRLEQRPLGQWCLWGGCAAALAAVVLGGVAVNHWNLGYRTTEVEVAALEYVRDHKQSGDVYLLPVNIPALHSGRWGLPSTTFTEPPRPKDGNLIPIDLQGFRLFTGAPIYVDFKAIPYKDVEVLEWYRRVLKAHAWYEQHDWGQAVQEQLRQAGITHVVLPADRSAEGETLDQVHGDAHYRIYRVRPPR